MDTVKRMLIALATLLVMAIAVGFLLPSAVHVERSVTIAAPQCTVFTLVNGFRHFNRWSPWHQVDPGVQYTFEGPEYGAGARMTWISEDSDVGSGSQTLLESDPSSRVKMALDFGAEGTAEAALLLTPVISGTRVTWAFDKDFGYNLVGRYLGFFYDSRIGIDYEKGLAALKAYAESLPKADWSDIEIETVEVLPLTVAFTSGVSSRDHDEITKAVAAAYSRITRFMRRNRLEQSAAPIVITSYMDERGYGFDAAIPIRAVPDGGIRPDPAVKIDRTYGGPVVRAVHIGPNRDVQGTYEKVMAFIAAHGLEAGERPWEQYISDHATVAESEQITHIYHPVR